MQLFNPTIQVPTKMQYFRKSQKFYAYQKKKNHKITQKVFSAYTYR